MSSYLVFALGPVQGFIAQSRRTADGWMGSYLLSYLIGRVLCDVEKLCGRDSIIEPSVDEVATYKAIKGERLRADEDPTIAALPNTILLQLQSAQEPNEIGTKCKSAVDAAWREIHSKVWEQLPAAMQAGARTTWEDQVKRHWETYWAWGSTEREAFKNLAARKGLRNFEPWEEDGDRCTVCGQRMPLVDRVALKGAGTVQAVAANCWRSGPGGQGWADRLNHLLGAPRTLVRNDGGERLCAICLIKRLLPWVENPVQQLWQGRDGVAAFPSTATMCTSEYRVELLRAAARTPALMHKIEAYKAAVEVADAGSERELTNPRLPLAAFDNWVTCAGDLRAAVSNVETFLRLDGDFYLYGDSVANERGFSETDASAVQREYRRMIEAAKDAGLKPPPIYWALLVMDGDQMGAFLRRAQDAGVGTTSVSTALNKFAQAVPKIVSTHGGRTVFAGGDDVLALFPLPSALDAANALRVCFRTVFEDWHKAHGGSAKGLDDTLPTISAAIVYVHHQAPLGRVIQAGHALLQGWAKARAGRDAVAIQRFMRGGPAETLTCKWGDAGADFPTRMAETIQLMTDGDRGPVLADRTAYNLRRFAWMLGSYSTVFADNHEHRKAFLMSLLSKSRLGEERGEGDGVPPASERERREQRQQALADRAAHLLDLCDADVTEHPDRRDDRLSLDPLIIARFLAGEGRVER